MPDNVSVSVVIDNENTIVGDYTNNTAPMPVTPFINPNLTSVLTASAPALVAGSNTIVPGVAGKTIKIWRFVLQNNSATFGASETFAFFSNAAPLWGGFVLTLFAQGGSAIFDQETDPWFQCAQGDPFNVTTAGTGTPEGVFWYTQT